MDQESPDFIRVADNSPADLDFIFPPGHTPRWLSFILFIIYHFLP